MPDRAPASRRVRRGPLVLVLLAVALLAAPARPQAPLALADGALSGDVTATGAVIWTRTTVPASVRVEYGTSAALGTVSQAVRAEAGSDFTVHLDLTGLRPGTRYYYRAVAEAGDRRAAGLVGSFTTAPAPGEAAEVALAWSADMSERFKPYRIFDAMRARAPDFLLFLGDMVYADIDANARTLGEYRLIHRRNRDDEAFFRFARGSSIYAVWDDHEVANNFDRTHERLPLGRQALFESWPIRRNPADPHRLYRAVRWGRLVELFILDTRQYRSPPFDRDTAQKTMLGAAQKEWLKRGLLASTATFKIIGTTVPLKFHGVDSWEGYTTERDEILEFITRNGIPGVVMLSGDVHYAAVLRHREGFVEAIAGPLAQLINRRRPAAGEPEAEFTFNTSFTFGYARATPAGLILELYDVEGKLLHRTTVRP